MVKKLFFLLLVFISIVLFVNIVSATQTYLNESNQWEQNLTRVDFGSAIVGDLNGDGKLDLIITGTSSLSSNRIKVYINNGTTLTENQTWQQNLTAVQFGSLALGDINNDGRLDLVLSGCTDINGGSYLVACSDGNYQIFVYINNGTSFVESSQWENNLTKTSKDSLAIGDINNDGKLDLALSGDSSTSKISKIYLNNGTSFVESSQWENNLIPLDTSSLAFGDINNDGKLDLAICGDAGVSDERSNIYLNNGTSFVENQTWEQNLLGVDLCSLAFGDFDNDGKLDLSLIGHTTQDNHRIYRNNGTSFLEIQNEANDLGGIFMGSLAFGDYNNDGYLDLSTTGYEGFTFLYLYNNSNTKFTTYPQDPESNILDLKASTIVWVDLNNDTSLDLIETGFGGGGGGDSQSLVYLSNRSLTKNNTIPNASISSFASNYSITNTQLNLSWGSGSDNETNTSGLYYNLMVGNSTMNNTIVSGVYGGSSNPTAGYFGNMMERKNITLNNIDLTAGTYYWYVQTIDTGLAKSAWSAPQNFTVGTDTTKPTITSVASSSITTSSATITWITDENSNSTVYYGTTTATTSSSRDNTLTQGHSITLTGLSSSTNYYYNVSSCDFSNNCNTSTQSSFTTSATAVSGSSGGGSSGGGGGGGTTTINPTTNQTISKFDVDFSTSTTGTLEMGQGDVKTFSFNGETTHKITATEITATSAKLIIESEPIILILNVGETKSVDINKDNISDVEIKLISITNGQATISLTKLAGADTAGQEEIAKEALFDVKVSLSNLFNVVLTGREVIAKIEVLNVNNIGQVDVAVNYYITSKEDNTTRLAEGSDTLAVEAVASFVRSLTVPYNLKAGNYLFNVDVKYKGQIIASGKAEFSVIKSYEIIIVIITTILIVGGVFFYLWTIKRKQKKIEGQIKVLRKSMGNKIFAIRKRGRK